MLLKNDDFWAKSDPFSIYCLQILKFFANLKKLLFSIKIHNLGPKKNSPGISGRISKIRPRIAHSYFQPLESTSWPHNKDRGPQIAQNRERDVSGLCRQRTVGYVLIVILLSKMGSFKKYVPSEGEGGCQIWLKMSKLTF